MDENDYPMSRRRIILTSIAWTFILVSTFALLKTGCHPATNSSDNGFRVEHSARMGGHVYTLSQDTTKPMQMKVKYSHYRLDGSDTLFRFLLFALQNPDDVSKNQKTQLLNWIQSVKIDSTR
jgi:hypothetical protein